jgi:pyruvate-ferredoxin/flavodoxin oxidoreductase
VIDAYKVARDLGMPGRINWVMNACFFALSGVLPRDQAIAALKVAIEKTYAHRDQEVVERNQAAVDRALLELRPLPVPAVADVGVARRPTVSEAAPDFVARVTARMMAGEGDLLPVSALPVDGTFPTGTSRWEKRSIAESLPVWDPDICIDCGKCTIVCPHAAIRMKVFEPGALDGAPDSFLSKAFRSKDLAGHNLAIQVAPDDCTGCGICADVCPAKSKTVPGHKSIDMAPALERREQERENWRFFAGIPPLDRGLLPHDSVKGSQVLEPLFEFSGACAGCGETPYLKLLTQLFGDRMLVANATGCSSIFGGNLPTTPWACNDAGRGPAWSNSLFEDNAEFGLGLLLGLENQRHEAERLLGELAGCVGPTLAEEILGAVQDEEHDVAAQRERVATLKRILTELDGQLDGRAARLLSVADTLVRKSVWMVGGDGWAYDIGFGGLDHVLASGRNVNVLVLDTEVYSNTGGQASKATPRGAVAKFAAAGKVTGKKDLGALARSYGNVYVAQIAIGANDIQTVKALLEAEAWPGPSLIIAYSTCIAHGIEMSTSMSHQKEAVQSGYWPLYRYHPGEDAHQQPFRLDSKKPTLPVSDFTAKEERFALLAKTDPERAVRLAELEQSEVDERWRHYEQLGAMERTVPHRTEDGET